MRLRTPMGQRSPCPFEPGGRETHRAKSGHGVQRRRPRRVARPRRRMVRGRPVRTACAAVSAVCLLLLGACASTSAAYTPVADYQEPPAPPTSGYVIQPGDVLQIRVFNQPDMSTRAKVRDDGKVSIPFLNDVVASGFTPNALAQQLQTATQGVHQCSGGDDLARGGPTLLGVRARGGQQAGGLLGSGRGGCPPGPRRGRAVSPSTHPATRSSWCAIRPSGRGSSSSSTS